MKEISRIKSSFIHATRGGWEQLPLLKDQLLESQEKLLQTYKDLIALGQEKLLQTYRAQGFARLSMYLSSSSANTSAWRIRQVLLKDLLKQNEVLSVFVELHLELSQLR